MGVNGDQRDVGEAGEAQFGGVFPFWTYMAEQGRWRRQWRERIVRVLGPTDTSPVWRDENGSRQPCDCCVTGQPHSWAYHTARVR
jgi:hypothetical protein